MLKITVFPFFLFSLLHFGGSFTSFFLLHHTGVELIIILTCLEVQIIILVFMCCSL